MPVLLHTYAVCMCIKVAGIAVKSEKSTRWFVWQFQQTYSRVGFNNAVYQAVSSRTDRRLSAWNVGLLAMALAVWWQHFECCRMCVTQCRIKTISSPTTTVFSSFSPQPTSLHSLLLDEFYDFSISAGKNGIYVGLHVNVAPIHTCIYPCISICVYGYSTKVQLEVWL